MDRSIDGRASPLNRYCEPGTIVAHPIYDRRQTGGYFTSRCLIVPMVADALMPILDQLGDVATPDELFAIKVSERRPTIFEANENTIKKYD